MLGTCLARRPDLTRSRPRKSPASPERIRLVEQTRQCVQARGRRVVDPQQSAVRASPSCCAGRRKLDHRRSIPFEWQHPHTGTTYQGRPYPFPAPNQLAQPQLGGCPWRNGPTPLNLQRNATPVRSTAKNRTTPSPSPVKVSLPGQFRHVLSVHWVGTLTDWQLHNRTTQNQTPKSPIPIIPTVGQYPAVGSWSET